MKVLVATRRTQGDRPTDFVWTTDGELVSFPSVVCVRDREDPDGGCGCGRSWSGLNSHRAGTTAEVVELEMTREDYITAIASSVHQGGWTSEEKPAAVTELANELLDIADSYPVGAVLGNRLGAVEWRS